MKELGITKGEYSWERYEYLSYVKAGGKMICSFTELPNDQELALCKLFTDAGNTAQKCGLLPSELLRQRDELREALAEQKRLYFNLFDEDVSCMYCEVKLKRGSAIILCKECAESTEV